MQRLIRPGEELTLTIQTADALLAIITEQVAVIQDGRPRLVARIDNLRRIELDIEKGRPATLVIVPDDARLVPQILSASPDEYAEVAAALVEIAHGISGKS